MEASSLAESPAVAESRTSFAIGINGAQLTVEPADTEAARALMERLQAGPVTVSLHAYGGRRAPSWNGCKPGRSR